jgi:hypothetical protein
MLYKVTPMMPVPQPSARKVREPGQPRKRRKTAVYDGEGHEVLITLMCLKCHKMKPLMQFGLRKMADGAIRNQPWCRTCRGAAGTKKKPAEAEVLVVAQVAQVAPALAEPVTEELTPVVAEPLGPLEAGAPAPIAVLEPLPAP